ncbi:MAG TPA: gluconokinase [Spirochaetia bacterium]|nr:gluconokinase [Spirochaetia bacterium]
MVILVMGVSGSGKSTVGLCLARRLGVPFIDADDFHEEASIQKMRGGIPLEDRDRTGWLSRIASRLAREERAVLACSALRERYRRVLRKAAPHGLRIVYLYGDLTLVRQRLIRRLNHFFDARLLESQFAELEEPTQALRISIEKPPDDIVQDVIRGLFHAEGSDHAVPEDK